MAVSAEKFLQGFATGRPPAAILLLGSDAYLLALCRKAIIRAFVPEAARGWAVLRLSARDCAWDDIFQRAQSMPMLSPRQTILISDAEAFETLEDQAGERALAGMASYFDDPAPFTLLVFEAAKLDERRRLFKLLSAKALTVSLTVPSESSTSLVLQMASELGATLDQDAAALLCDVLGGEMARIHLELDKLALYASARRITAADVEALVVSERKYTVWQLADMLATRRRDAAFLFLDSLIREGEPPPAIVGALAWMYRKLIEAHQVPPHASRWDAARILGMRPEAADIAMRQARRIPRADLLAGLAALAEADSELKSGRPDSRAILEFLLSRLMGQAAAPEASITR